MHKQFRPINMAWQFQRAHAGIVHERNTYADDRTRYREWLPPNVREPRQASSSASVCFDSRGLIYLIDRTRGALFRFAFATPLSLAGNEAREGTSGRHAVTNSRMRHDQRIHDWSGF